MYGLFDFISGGNHLDCVSGGEDEIRIPFTLLLGPAEPRESVCQRCRSSRATAIPLTWDRSRGQTATNFWLYNFTVTA